VPQRSRELVEMGAEPRIGRPRRRPARCGRLSAELRDAGPQVRDALADRPELGMIPDGAPVTSPAQAQIGGGTLDARELGVSAMAGDTPVDLAVEHGRNARATSVSSPAAGVGGGPGGRGAAPAPGLIGRVGRASDEGGALLWLTTTKPPCSGSSFQSTVAPRAASRRCRRPPRWRDPPVLHGIARLAARRCCRRRRHPDDLDAVRAGIKLRKDHLPELVAGRVTGSGEHVGDLHPAGE
jgi:hypothetical protein